MREDSGGLEICGFVCVHVTLKESFMGEEDTKDEKKISNVTAIARRTLSPRERREDDRAFAIARPQKKPG